MKTFTLKNKFQTNATLVANDFIENVFIVLSLFSGIYFLT